MLWIGNQYYLRNLYIFRRICRRDRQFLIVSVVLIAVIVTVWYFNPEDAIWMPKCPLKHLTGYDCPGCGATRALHAVLHGDIYGAIRYNLFLVIGVAYAALAVLVSRIKATSRYGGFRRVMLGKTVGWIYITLFFAWWILRNILDI